MKFMAKSTLYAGHLIGLLIAVLVLFIFLSIGFICIWIAISIGLILIAIPAGLLLFGLIGAVCVMLLTTMSQIYSFKQCCQFCV